MRGFYPGHFRAFRALQIAGDKPAAVRYRVNNALAQSAEYPYAAAAVDGLDSPW